MVHLGFGGLLWCSFAIILFGHQRSGASWGYQEEGRKNIGRGSVEDTFEKALRPFEGLGFSERF